MPRLLACNVCHILQRAVDPHPHTPMVPARLAWEDGTDYVYKDDDGKVVMVPAYDPILEDFVVKHTHDRPDNEVLQGQVIRVWQVDQKTWDSVDLVTKVKNELAAQTGTWYEDRDVYREGAIECYNAHGNPTIHNKCKDFMDDSKLIGKKTYVTEDRDVNIPKPFRQYLCYQCPYFQSEIVSKQRWKNGGRTTPKKTAAKKLSYNQAVKHIKKNRTS